MTAPSVVRDDVKEIVRLAGKEFARLNGKTLLITGGTGFIGSYLIESLAYVNDHVLSNPCQVFVLTRNPAVVSARFPYLATREDFVLVEGDVRTVQPPSVPWHFVIHAAAPSDTRLFLRDPVGTMETIVDGTKAVLRAAARATPEAVLFVSSGAVYGYQPSALARLSEDYSGGPDLGNPRSCYAEAKRCAELLCRVFQAEGGLPVSIARLFTIVGPYQDLNSTSAVLDFIRQSSEGETITIRDDATAVRSYCYIADAVTALWKILLGCQPGEVLNVGSDLEAVSFRELAARISRCLGKPLKVVVEGKPALGIVSHRYVPDVARLYQRTGFRPETTLDEALRRTITWMQTRSHGDMGLGREASG